MHLHIGHKLEDRHIGYRFLILIEEVVVARNHMDFKILEVFREQVDCVIEDFIRNESTVAENVTAEQYRLDTTRFPFRNHLLVILEHTRQKSRTDTVTLTLRTKMNVSHHCNSHKFYLYKKNAGKIPRIQI